MSVPATASQTVGPYYKIGLEYRCGHTLCSDDAPGEHIELTGMLYDGDGVPVPDAQLELWQADDQGRYVGLDSGTGPSSEGFAGFARVAFDEAGCYRFHTVKPGVVTAPDGCSYAPHILVLIFMRGLLRHLYTRIYFDGEPANETDAALQAVPADRRDTLIAKRVEGKPNEYLWNIHLQGDNETAFFAY
jgi:protocatechuate 3,4-dioxygenase alpha subunit